MGVVFRSPWNSQLTLTIRLQLSQTDNHTLPKQISHERAHRGHGVAFSLYALYPLCALPGYAELDSEPALEGLLRANCQRINHLAAKSANECMHRPPTGAVPGNDHAKAEVLNFCDGILDQIFVGVDKVQAAD
jgi:hypothetical protein